MTQGPCWKVILLFSLPVILSYLLQQVYSISDAAIVGQTLTAAEVAGVNDTNSLVFIFLQFAFGVSAGFCVITSYYVGMHDERGVRRSLATQLLLSAALTVVLTALALVLLDPMLAWINVTPAHHEVYTAAHTYCAIIFAGIGAQLFYNFICSFLRAMGDSVTPLVFLLFSTILNVGLDLLFILSFRWGVAGAAGATVLAQLVSTIGCFIYAFVRYPVLRLHREDWRITMMDVKRHLTRGIPLGLQFSVLAVGIIVMQGGVVQFDMRDGVMVSNAAQNGFGAANRLFNLVATPMNALGGAMTSFTAQNLGAGQYDRIRRGTLQALGMVSILAILAAGTGLLLTRGDFCYHVFLSADKVRRTRCATATRCCMWTSPCTCFWASSLWCATACRASGAAASCWARARRSWWRVSPCVWCCRGCLPAAPSAPMHRPWPSTPSAPPTPWRGSRRIRCCASPSSATYSRRTMATCAVAAHKSIRT